MKMYVVATSPPRARDWVAEDISLALAARARHVIRIVEQFGILLDEVPHEDGVHELLNDAQVMAAEVCDGEQVVGAVSHVQLRDLRGICLSVGCSATHKRRIAVPRRMPTIASHPRRGCVPCRHHPRRQVATTTPREGSAQTLVERYRLPARPGGRTPQGCKAR
jgi:hypothetical protein